MAVTQLERLTTVETKLDIVIQNQEKLTTKLDAVVPTLVTQNQLAERIASLQVQVAEAKAAAADAKKKNTVWVFVTSTGAAGFTFLLTILIQSYFDK